MPGSWPTLNDALKSIPPVGLLGLESLVADLLRAYIKQPFFLARTGDQPSGDIYSPKEGIVVQVKRYTSTNFSENEIIGEVDRAIESVVDLDLYVLVATRPLGQLTARLEHLAARTGIDVIPITLTDGVSDLGCLCVSHWEAVRRYFPELDESWVKWAAERQAESEIKSHVEALDAAFQSAHTRGILAKQCLNALTHRFSKDNAIDNAVNREVIRTELITWWDGRDKPIAVLEGEEGAGKSWTAASLAFEISKVQNAIVFWLDSHLWADAKSPERIVDLCLENVITGDDSLRKKIKRKIIHHWTSPILIVLDGANERSACDATESIVKSYRSHSDRIHRQVRLLFTTRPLATRASSLQQLWAGYAKVEVVPFTVAELDQALQRLGANVGAKELPSGVRELARIPRYLKLCMELRQQLESFWHVSKELLLWVDLCNKVAKSDSQIRTIEEVVAASPEALLSELAKRTGWPTSETVSVSKEKITDVFPDFDSIRSDLIEQRIVLSTSTPSTVELSASHVVLGWALWLRQLSDRKHSADREDLRNELLKALEPAASNDLKAKALQVASLLSFYDASKLSAQQTKSLLLELWIRHHNAIITAKSLEYFVARDIVAYASAIEGLFVDHFRGYLETQLTIPLVRIWRDDLPQRLELRIFLVRWLTLIFPGGPEGSREKNIYPPARFPVAGSPEQLRLTYVAISIISFRPDLNLLETLVDSYLSQDFCYSDVPSEAPAHRIPVKWCCEALGYLMRWSYNETIIPRLVAMAVDPKLSGFERESVGWFARLLRQATLPSELGPPEDVFSGGGISPSEDIRNLETYLSDAPPPKGRKLIGFGSLAAWSVRMDLPQLSESGVCGLKEKMEWRATNPGQAVYSGTWDNEEFEDLLIWAAKLVPATLETVAVKWWEIQIDKDHFTAALETLVALGITHPKLASIIDDVLRKLPQNKSIDDLVHAIVTPVTEMIMLHGTVGQIVKWFHWLEDQFALPTGSPIVSLLPLPTVIRLLAGPDFVEYAKMEAHRLGEQWQVAPDTINVNVLAFWLETYAYSSSNEEELAEWGLELAERPDVPRKLWFPLFLMASRSANLAVILRGLRCSVFQRYKDGYNAWRWGLGLSPSSSSVVQYYELQSSCSLTIGGWILFNLKAPELQLWGMVVLKRASAALAVSTENPVQCKVVQEIQPNGRLGLVSHERLPPGRTSHHTIHSATWGIDRSSEIKSPTNEQYKAASDAVSEEMERRRSLPVSEIIGFNAFEPLRKWASNNQSEFFEFAFDYLTSFRTLSPDRRQEFANFANDVFIIFLQYEPERAMSFLNNEFADLHVVDSKVGLPWPCMVVWSNGLNNVPQIEGLRDAYLDEALNDEVILQHVIAARRGEVNLEAIALKGLRKSQAKERALSVTILAFLGTASAAATLTTLLEEDHSLWVRAHARWAFEVCVTESHCQTWYSKVLIGSCSLSQLGTNLVVMEPALTATSAIWRHRVEREVTFEKWDSRMRGHLQLFWRRVEQNSFREGAWKILGRRLIDYCRGESLKDGVTSQQSPWWKASE